MKITKELESKINRLLDEKYLPLLADNNKILQTAKEELIPIIQDELEKLMCQSHFLSVVLQHELCRIDRINLAKEYATRHVEKMPEMKEIIKQHLENRDHYKLARATEYENLAIAISYQKDLNGIREAFKESGFDF